MLTPSTLFDSLFNDMFSMPSDFGRLTSRASGLMNTDVQESDNSYHLELELPGYDKADIQADMNDGYLTIHAKHSDEKDEKDRKGRYIRRERYYGECSRSFYVGEDIKQEDIKASFANGILTLDIPKKEATPAVEQRQYISIE